jgi:hypothetical protein
MAFSSRWVMKTEGTAVARQSSMIGLAGLSSTSAAWDFARATGVNRLVLGARAQGLAEGEGDGDE